MKWSICGLLSGNLLNEIYFALINGSILKVTEPENVYKQYTGMVNIKYINTVRMDLFIELNNSFEIKGIKSNRQSFPNVAFLFENGKGKVSPTHAMNTCRGNGDIAPFILNLATKWQ